MFQRSETSDTIRTVDPLGRIVLPKKVRLALGVEGGDTVQIQPVEGGFLLTRGPAASGGEEEKPPAEYSDRTSESVKEK